MNSKPILIVLCGPTAVGKTSCAIDLAKHYDTEIISADSRQFYKEIPLGTAAPTPEEMSLIKHHFVGNKSIEDYYNVSIFENECLDLLKSKFIDNPIMIMVGGSGLYIDAVCKGIDQLPDIDVELRDNLNKKYKDEGLLAIQEMLKELDPIYYAKVDLKNPKRILRALEVCLQTEKPYSLLRKGRAAKRDFEIIKVGLEMPREQLNNRIERRLSTMINEGWLEEAESVFEKRDLNSLNTVGYKELFDYLDGSWSLEMAMEKILVNTRRYAKRQMTWFKKDQEINWFSPLDIEKIIEFIDFRLSKS